MDIANRRIAKNTVYLYIRTAIVLFVSLYTSRLIFQALGVIDMGIYNVVGGIVTLMTFLQAALTNATSRFITYELGLSKQLSSQANVFAICITIHLLLAIIAVVFTETIGLWAVNHWISVPDDRIIAARYIYQFAIISFLIQIIRVPYDAVIIAHEEMSVYAYMSIIEVLLQLGLALILKSFAGDRLILYGGLRAIVCVLLFALYYGYVRYKHRHYMFRWRWDKSVSLKILAFSGWTLLGSGTNTMTQQGLSLLMNNFVGLVANTALGFAQQVDSAVGRFVSSFSAAFNPQVIKLYASGEFEKMHVLIRRASKFSFVLCYLFALPLIINMPFVLKIWLSDVPDYTVAFCQLMLVCSLFDSTTGVFNTAITAQGNVKYFQIGISISFVLDLLCAYLLLVLHFYPPIVFGSRIITRGCFNMFIEFVLMKRQLDFDVRRYIKEVLFPLLLTIVLTVPVVYFTSRYFEAWPKLLITTVESTIIILTCLYLIVMNNSERLAVYGFIKNKFHKA